MKFVVSSSRHPRKIIVWREHMKSYEREKMKISNQLKKWKNFFSKLWRGAVSMLFLVEGRNDKLLSAHNVCLEFGNEAALQREFCGKSLACEHNGTLIIPFSLNFWHFAPRLAAPFVISVTIQSTVRRQENPWHFTSNMENLSSEQEKYFSIIFLPTSWSNSAERRCLSSNNKQAFKRNEREISCSFHFKIEK